MTTKILIVDDESKNLGVLNNCLYQAGFEVLVAEDGEMALKLSNYNKPDLILLDIVMPDMDGFEVCRRLKQNEAIKNTPIIFLTAKTDIINKVKGLEMSAVDYITKPFQTEEVVARVEKHLTIANLRQQLEAKNAQLQDSVYHLESLANLGKTISETQDITQMMDKIMQVALAVFKCDRAWLLYPCDPNATSWCVPIETTMPEYPGANILNTNIPMQPAIAEIMQNALSKNGPIAFGPEHEHKVPYDIGEQFAVQSQLNQVIYPKIGKPWLFGIHQCSHARVWNENELKLFQEFGQQIGVSLGFSISVEELHRGQEYLSRKSYHNFIGASTPMQKIYQTIDNTSNSEASILISGETGTGKELCAEAIHKESNRADQPFIIFDCATVPNDLMESQLFGHVRGAFTNAIKDRQGAALRADGGTLFLDEIGEIPLNLQSTLLRFIQTKTFHQVGSDEVKQVDIRLICASNRNLSEEVKAGRFREDLYFRINHIEINLPTLRERESDILLLAKFFLFKFAKQEQKTFQSFSPKSEQILLDYKWPGNVRELRNIVHNLVILNKGKVITAEMLETKIDDKNTSPSIESNQPLELAENHVDVISDNHLRSFKEIEQDIIFTAIKFCEGNITQTAKLLGIGKATIFSKLKQYKLENKLL
ncbi:sigma 54-interacting transcriptional regulator [Candidatus Halobeggiatoa sp. HSG11]|nr:sigma 54-interacting transcriptional regulator [Candidatus Halobeggiatoa sp. HSG11]